MSEVDVQSMIEKLTGDNVPHQERLFDISRRGLVETDERRVIEKMIFDYIDNLSYDVTFRTWDILDFYGITKIAPIRRKVDRTIDRLLRNRTIRRVSIRKSGHKGHGLVQAYRRVNKLTVSDREKIIKVFGRFAVGAIVVQNIYGHWAVMEPDAVPTKSNGAGDNRIIFAGEVYKGRWKKDIVDAMDLYLKEVGIDYKEFQFTDEGDMVGNELDELVESFDDDDEDDVNGRIEIEI